MWPHPPFDQAWLIAGCEAAASKQCTCRKPEQPSATIKAAVQLHLSTAPQDALPPIVSAPAGAFSIAPASSSSSSTITSLPQTASFTTATASPATPCATSDVCQAPAPAPVQPWSMQAAAAISLSDLSHPFGLPHVLGQGGMGQVILMKEASTHVLMAVKTPLLVDGHVPAQLAADLEREHAMNAFANLSGQLPHVAGYLGPVAEHGKLNNSLAFEFLAGGSMASNLR